MTAVKPQESAANAAAMAATTEAAPLIPQAQGTSRGAVVSR